MMNLVVHRLRREKCPPDTFYSLLRQGIYLCEHRNHASSRKLIITVGV